MTRRSKGIRLGAGVAALLLLVGCHRTGSSAHSPHAARPAAAATSSSSTRSTVPTAAPAQEAAALEAMAVARAFTAAICPYNWRDPVPYGQRLDAALERWGTPGFAAARRWDSARTAAAAAGLLAHQAQQTCGRVTGGLDPETEPATGQLSVTVTAQAQGSAASTAQQVFDYQLVDQVGSWRISSGHW